MEQELQATNKSELLNLAHTENISKADTVRLVEELKKYQKNDTTDSTNFLR